MKNLGFKSEGGLHTCFDLWDNFETNLVGGAALNRAALNSRSLKKYVSGVRSSTHFSEKERRSTDASSHFALDSNNRAGPPLIIVWGGKNDKNQ